MQPQIHIRSLNINLRAPQVQGHTSPIPALLLAALASERTRQPEPTSPIILPAAINEELQGGIYAGPAIEDGKLIHLISASESPGQRDWEAAKTAASEYRGGGFDDWLLPSKPWLQTAQANGLVLQDGYHWTSTPYGQGSAWAVGFGDGYVYASNRTSEFRVRPFRRFIP